MFSINDRKSFELNVIFFVLVILFINQCLFYNLHRNLKAFLNIVPTPPSEKAIKAMTFGDDEFYFRLNSFKVQNMGDTFGRMTPLKDYDYKKLYHWFIYLDKFDTRSNYLASIAAYYYSATQNVKDIIYVIKFLEKHADNNLKENWWWLYQATYLSKFMYGDDKLALRLARKLRLTSPKDAPLWTKRMEGIFLFNSDEDCESLRIMNEVLNQYENTATENDEQKAKELNYMKFFIEKNIEKLKNKNIDYTKCFKKKER